MRHSVKKVNGDYLWPCVSVEKKDGLVHIEFNGGDAYITRSAFKQLKFVLTHHVDLVASLLNGMEYEELIEELAKAQKEMG